MSNYIYTKERNHYVAMSNKLIFNAKYGLTATEYDIMFYLISKIKPTDEPEKMYSFKIGDMSRVLGKNQDTGTYYGYLRDALISIREKVITLKLEPKKTLITGWFNEAIIDKDTGIISISFSKNITPYLFRLRESGDYSMFIMRYGTDLILEPAKRLFILLNAVKYRGKIYKISIENLRKEMECGEQYKEFKDFRRYVLEKSISDINKNTNLYITYEVELKGRKAVGIDFYITVKSDDLPY